MSERIISITSYSPLEIYGVNDRNINLIKSFFPKLKIVARGEMIKAIGSNDILDDFEEKFELLLVSYDKFGKLAEKDIYQRI
jgi:phosphate starvation-inducible PhoH-like protein